MKKFILLLLFAPIALAGSLTSCSQAAEQTECPPSGNPAEGKEGLVGRGLSGDSPTQSDRSENGAVAFTDTQIAWFDPATREISFRGIEPAIDLSPYTAIRFELDGEPLFTAATIAAPVSNFIVSDLVLYFEYTTDGRCRYYLHDGYPLWAGRTDEGLANAARRAAGWQRFIDYLHADGRLRDTGDDSDDPGLIVSQPSMPCVDRGDIPLQQASCNPDWRLRSTIEYNTLYVIRSEEELMSLVTDATYTRSGIDFGTHSLLLVCITAPKGIERIEYGLSGSADRYAYSVTAPLLDTDECPRVLFAALAPVLSPAASVSFAFDTPYDKGDDPEQPHPNCYDIGDIPLTRYAPAQFFAWKWTGVSENSLAVIGSEEELARLVTPDTYTPSGIDFSKNALLLTRIRTLYGIDRIYCALDRTGAGYHYTMNPWLNCAAVVEDLYVAMLAPIDGSSDVRFDFYTGESPEQPYPLCYDTGEVPLTRYATPQFLAWEWTGLPENSLAVIESEEALMRLVAPGTYTPSGIDFSKNTLLLTRIFTLSGIAEIYCALDRNGAAYDYTMDVRLNCATVVEDVYVAMLAPVDRGAEIRFIVDSSE